MAVHINRKKKLIISYKNLSDDIRELFKDAYPDGYKDYIQKTIKPNGEPLFVVPLETEDTSYMIKFDVKIDTTMVEEDIDKDLYEGDEENNEGEFAPLSEAINKEEGNRTVGKLQHGAYEEIFEGLPEDKKEFEMANEDLEYEYGDRPDEGADDMDSYIDGEDEDEEDEDEDMEPDDDELLDIEAILAEADSGEGILREENPPEEEHHRGRKKKDQSADIKAVKAVGAAVKEARKGTKTTKAKTTADADKTSEGKKTTRKK